MEEQPPVLRQLTENLDMDFHYYLLPFLQFNFQLIFFAPIAQQNYKVLKSATKVKLNSSTKAKHIKRKKIVLKKCPG